MRPVVILPWWALLIMLPVFIGIAVVYVAALILAFAVWCIRSSIEAERRRQQRRQPPQRYDPRVWQDVRNGFYDPKER